MMNGTRHSNCMGRCCLHQWVGKRPEVDLVSHLKRVEEVIHGLLVEAPNDYLRFEDNQTLFFLLTLLGDLAWHYRINDLHPKNRAFYHHDRCCLCD